MTLSQAMTREELLEFAGLDAFGLLDEIDAERYNRAFQDSPPTVQEEIRRVQAELVIDPALIAVEAEPPVSLRERVLAAVAAAIEREEAQLAPLATIGRGRHGEAEYQPQRLRFASAGMFWRAACFVLAAGCLLMGYQWSSAVRQGNYIAELALRSETEKQLRAMIGPEFTDFIKSNANSRAVALRPADKTYPGQATLYIKDTETGDASVFLLAMGLPASGENEHYSLRVKVGNAFQDVKQFVSNGIVAAVRLDNLKLSAALLASASWEIRDASNKIVLSA